MDLILRYFDHFLGFGSDNDCLNRDSVHEDAEVVDESCKQEAWRWYILKKRVNENSNELNVLGDYIELFQY